MNKQVMVGVGVSLLVLAVLIFIFTRGMSGGSDSASLSKEMPKARAGDPTFAPDVPTGASGGRGSLGRKTDSVPSASPKANDGLAAPDR